MSVEYSVDDCIARIELNNPDRLNALNPEVIDELCNALEKAIAEDVAAVIISGRGKAFCAGHDLKYDLGDIDYATDRRNVERTQDITRLIRRAPFPVVAAVHGYAVGAGCELALCSDLIIAAEEAMFGFPEVGVGLSITGGISHILPLTVGPAKAKELVLLGERISASEAHRLGLINFVVPGVDLARESLRLAHRLAQLPPHALGLAKRALDRGPQGDLSSAFELETLHALDTRVSAEATQAATAFRKQ